MTHEKINQLINKLEILKNSERDFVYIIEQEKTILKQLRDRYQKYSDEFDLKLVERINALKNDLALIEEYQDLKEEFQFCKTKEAADDVISSMILIYERISNGTQIKRVQTDFKKIYHESGYENLPHDKLIKTAHQSTRPECPYCSSKMILRNSFYGTFWGCSRFPSCWGKRNK